VSKRLIQNDVLTEIAQTVTAGREDHKRLTSPWLDNGTRILPAAMFDPYHTAMEKHETRFWPLVETFIDRYPEYIEQAALNHLALGQLFNRDDYPSLTKIRNAFGWTVKHYTIPDSDDFRVNVPNSVVKRMKAEIEDSLNTAAANAVRDVLERANECVSRMVESLTCFNPNASGKDRHTFHDSMIGNIRDLVSVMPGLNFTGDKRIDQLAADMVALCQHDAETLRSSDNIRAGVAAKAIEIASAVADFMA